MLLNFSLQRSLGLLAAPLSLISLAWILPADAKPDAPVPAGQKIYLQQCAACHGKKGEGAKAYPKPLTGTRTASELAKFIAQSMPPGPKQCTAPDAKKVAAYIHDTFYSSLAQARNKPARVALSRLTVLQFRNAVADLVGSSRLAVPNEKQHGLRGEYFKSKDFRSQERVFERVDPEVQFDFGTATPAPEGFEPHRFSIHWQGSVLAPDTGEYEFVVKSDHGVRLWVNNNQKPLIDASIKSGSGTEFHGVLTLLGGRAYPLKLEFSKSSVGVDDAEKKKGKPAPPASIALFWKRPKRTAEPIPARCLFPSSVPETFVAATPFPPDDRSIGYERGTSISKAWDEAITTAALETAHFVVANLKNLSGVEDNAPDRKEKLQAYCRQWIERAFRKPITDADAKFYIGKQFQTAPDAENAVKRVVLLSLKSPRFLYREIGAQSTDAYAVASRLSFGLWDTVPDTELLQAASKGELATREQVTKQAERMVADPRSWNKLRAFLLFWLKVDDTHDLAKNQKRYAGFDAVAASDLRTSLELFLENVVWSEKSDYRELMLSNSLYLNGKLAKLYGANLPENSGFEPVTLDPKQRAGVLTHPYILSNFAYLDTSSPIHRGVLIARNMLGRTLAPPPDAFTPLAPDLHPKLTTRQRVAMQTKPDACNSCHSMINPLGFTLERFDAIGRLREIENDQKIDTTGSYRARNGQLVKFNDAPDLARFLANSDEAHSAFVEKLFHHLVKQPVLAYGGHTLPDLQRGFGGKGYNIRKLMVEIMATTALPKQTPSESPKRVGGIQ